MKTGNKYFITANGLKKIPSHKILPQPPVPQSKRRIKSGERWIAVKPLHIKQISEIEMSKILIAIIVNSHVTTWNLKRIAWAIFPEKPILFTWWIYQDCNTYFIILSMSFFRNHFLVESSANIHVEKPPKNPRTSLKYCTERFKGAHNNIYQILSIPNQFQLDKSILTIGLIP